jgi:serine/threonine-protein kinase
MLAGKYRVERVLGEGGMGVVFAARHELLGQRVAIKTLRPEITEDEEAVARFLNEARSVSRIRNEHVARVLDVATLEDGAPYMVLELLEGFDLGQLLEQSAPLPIAEVVDYLLQALEGVAQAHALGIVHRDLKPANLFLARGQDGTSQIKVLDFGIAKATDPSGIGRVTKTNVVLGSPAYMPPEQLRDSKAADARSDIWSIGVIAYELLTCALPYVADSAVGQFALIQEKSPAPIRSLRSDVPDELDGAVLKCLRRNPDQRFASVAEVAHALAPYGTRVASLAYERLVRIVGTNANAPSPTAHVGDSMSASRLAQAHAATVASWAATPPRRRLGAFEIATGVVTALAFAISAALIVRGVERSPSSQTATPQPPTPDDSASIAPLEASAPSTNVLVAPSANVLAAPSASATPSSRRPAAPSTARPPQRPQVPFSDPIFNRH